MIILLTSLAIFFGILTVILGFTTYNLLRKNEKQEDILAGYLNYLDQLSRAIEISDTKLKKLDERGVFKSDDEVGFFFTNLQKIQNILNEFQLKKF
jgi:hypothetical protein